MSEGGHKEMTVDEFLATAEQREGRWEIEYGVAYAMEPERFDHARVNSRLSWRWAAPSAAPAFAARP